MTPKEYEQYIASIFQNQGYNTLVTPYSNDWGIDVIAIKGKEKIAIQAKMYGNKRKVNRAAIMQLYGAMAYQDCTKAVIATDGELLDDAISVAKKLKIEILTTKTNFVSTFHKEKEEENSDSIHKDFRMEYPTFDEVWRKYIMPLKGVTLWNTKGENKILDVNWGGITRITSNKRRSSISIDGFRFAYNELIRKGKITRDYINQEVDKRCSSGIVLILGQIPFVSTVRNPTSLEI